ncbi:MAG TPA: hypothetical protein VFV38_52265 [Ktedonobacteraceae bacterium]|nr:hypothetical protein [Ktedonobacteraceae bacterium]
MSLRLRELTEEEQKTIERLVHARSTPVGKLKRAQIIWLASQGQRTPEIAKQLDVMKKRRRSLPKSPPSERELRERFRKELE